MVVVVVLIIVLAVVMYILSHEGHAERYRWLLKVGFIGFVVDLLFTDMVGLWALIGMAVGAGIDYRRNRS